MTCATYRDLLHSIVRDDVAAISDDDHLDALAHGVVRYSRFRPRRFIVDLAAAANGVVSRTLATDLDDWDDEFSVVLSVEHPVDEVPPAHVDHETYDAPSARRLYAPDVVAGEMVRVTYTASHVVDADRDTTPAADSEAIASWAAGRLLEELAARGAAVTDSTIGADGIDHNRQTSDYRALAKGYRDRFYELLGLDRKDEMRTPGVAAVATLEPRRLSTGTRRLTHLTRLERYGA